MKVFAKLKRSLADDRQTMKSLSFRKKIRFILDYYKGYAFILLLLCMAIFYCADAVMTMQRETVLEGFFTNDPENLYPAKTISEDFSKVLNLSSHQQVSFDDSLYVELGSAIDYHASSQSKIVAYISARELDFLVTTKDLTEYYCKNFPLYDLEELIPAELLPQLQDQLYYAVDGNGEEKACAVSMEGTRFQQKSESEPHYLMVMSYTEHQEAMVEFLKYAFTPLE